MNNYYVIVSHTRFNEKGEAVHGTASELAPFLEKNKQPYLYLQHSLFSGAGTTIITYTPQKKVAKKYGFTSLPFPLRIMQEYLLTIYFVSKINSPVTFIGIDPLNAWLGIILKKMGRVKKIIFYTADYAHKRYANGIMNAIYHWFDKFCIKRADQIWNVSSRITKLRKKQGVPDTKNYFVPNAPILSANHRVSNSYTAHQLVIVTHITKAIDFMSILSAIAALKKKYKDISLLIVGNGEYRGALEKEVQSLSLSKQVIFTGSLSHDKVLNVLTESGVGLAIYTNDHPWTKFGDSMKAREYLAYGLPVIINDIPSTADDIEKAHAGIVITSGKQIENAIDSLFSNKREYAIMRDNAFALAKNSDFFTAVERTKLLAPSL